MQRIVNPRADGFYRKDWATAGRNMVVKSTGLKTPPLLHAALAGSIESAEFFLSDAPNRLYAEFGKSKAARDDPKLKHLRDSPGGFDRAIAKWLGADSEFWSPFFFSLSSPVSFAILIEVIDELVIHCAVLATPGQRANELLDYLTQTCPSALEKKNRDGDTPLMVACRLGRRQFVQILIAANADQSTRNLKGQNIVHATVSGSPDAHRLRALLDELDPDLRTSLFLQRTNLSENGNTPLQAWVAAATGASFSHRHRYYRREEKSMVRVLRLLLEYSGGQGLDMLNAAGDTSLHLAIMGRQLAIAKVLVDYKPSLLYRENAVGRTPAEVAYETLTATKLCKPDRIAPCRRQNIVDTHESWSAEDYLKASEKNTADENEPAEKSLVQELGLGGDYTNSELTEIRVSMGLAASEDDSRLAIDSLIAKQVIWDLCSATMLQHPGTRRLVSLNEANDVARRLGEQETSSRYFSIRPRRDEYEDEEDASGQADEDFVAAMLASRNPQAWLTLDQKGGEEAGFDKCDRCERYHD
jgi:ankyrin repeat protein